MQEGKRLKIHNNRQQWRSVSGQLSKAYDRAGTVIAPLDTIRGDERCFQAPFHFLSATLAARSLTCFPSPLPHTDTVHECIGD